MVAIQGINGVPEPRPDRPAKVRDANKSERVDTAPAKDDLVISSEAQAAAKLATLIRVANQQNDIRADLVAAARERIERGDYKNPEVVAKVAQRISKLLP